MATYYCHPDDYNHRRRPPIFTTSYLAMPGVQGGQGIEGRSYIACINYILSLKLYINQGRCYSLFILPSKGALTRPFILLEFSRLPIPCY
jgi:hypothetical protein